MLDLFFDLDGTLLDSQEGIIESIQHALRELNEDSPKSEELLWMIGPPLLQGFQSLLQDEMLAQQAVALFHEAYDDNENKYLADPYDGIGEMFDSFQAWDARLHVVTSKPQESAIEIVKHFGIDAYVENVFGAFADHNRADKTELLQFALDETGALPAQSVMIGDRHFDIFGAKNNDMFNIGVLWGFGDAQELREAEADMLAGHPSELPEIIHDLIGIE